MIKRTNLKLIELFKANLLWSYMKNRMIAICDVFLLCSDKFKEYEDDDSPIFFYNKIIEYRKVREKNGKNIQHKYGNI